MITRITTPSRPAALTKRRQQLLRKAARSDRETEAGDPVYAATDVHAWLESIARGRPARRPKPTSD
jgi:hypothetical protein